MIMQFLFKCPTMYGNLFFVVPRKRSYIPLGRRTWSTVATHLFWALLKETKIELSLFRDRSVTYCTEHALWVFHFGSVAGNNFFDVIVQLAPEGLDFV